MKILRITSIGYEGGGADNGIILLQPVLEKMGHEVKVLSSNLHPELPHFSDYEYEAIEYQPGILKFFYRCFYPKSYYAVKKALKEFEPDIVQLHSMGQISPSVLFLLKKYPTVMTIHGSEDFAPSMLLYSFPEYLFKKDYFRKRSLTIKGWLHYFYHTLVQRPFYHFGLKNVDAFIVFSRYMRSLLQKDGIDAAYIPNFTKLFDYDPINAESRKIIYVGRILKIKGIQYIIVSLPEIIGKFPDIKLLIAGKGGYENELIAYARKCAVQDHVEFVGHKDRAGLYELYKDSALLLMSSVWPEPFGKVGIEAMSVGRPVIASDVGGIPEWLDDGQTGFLVPPADAGAIADKVIQLLSDKTLLEKMSENARKKAERFDVREHAEKIIRVYEEVIKKHRGSK